MIVKERKREKKRPWFQQKHLINITNKKTVKYRRKNDKLFFSFLKGNKSNLKYNFFHKALKYAIIIANVQHLKICNEKILQTIFYKKKKLQAVLQCNCNRNCYACVVVYV